MLMHLVCLENKRVVAQIVARRIAEDLFSQGNIVLGGVVVLVVVRDAVQPFD